MPVLSKRDLVRVAEKRVYDFNRPSIHIENDGKILSVHISGPCLCSENMYAICKVCGISTFSKLSIPANSDLSSSPRTHQHNEEAMEAEPDRAGVRKRTFESINKQGPY